MKKIVKLTEQEFKNIIENVIIEQNNLKDYSTKLVNISPITGEKTWDITYQINLDKLYKEIDDIVNKIEKLIVQNKNDLQLKELLKLSKLLRNKFSRYKTKI